MPANNSKTNRSVRRAAALERFKISSTGPLRQGRSELQQEEAAAKYVERKQQELDALNKPMY